MRSNFQRTVARAAEDEALVGLVRAWVAENRRVSAGERAEPCHVRYAMIQDRVQELGLWLAPGYFGLLLSCVAATLTDPDQYDHAETYPAGDDIPY